MIRIRLGRRWRSALVALFLLTHWTLVSALDWVPTEQEMAKYRQSWNPPTHGQPLPQVRMLPAKGSGMSGPMFKE
jgi:hypothetical protein